MSDRRMRVIVGVHESVAGLRALRRAVVEARARGAVLHAVRAWSLPSSGCTIAPPMWRGDMSDAAADEVRRAFEAAMGGLPQDVEVRIVVTEGVVGAVLTGYADREEDLLVVGVGRHGWFGRLVSRPVAWYCVRNAACPVLAVPPHAFATAASTRALARALRREAGQLANPGAR